MSTALLSMPHSDNMQIWRRQIGQRSRAAAQRGPRPHAVISYLTRRPVVNQRIELRHFTLVALFDDRRDSGELVTRFVGVGGAPVDGGIRFGDRDLSRFDKDLRRPPSSLGHGRRLNRRDEPMLSLALQLERYLERCARHPYFPRRRVPLLPSMLVSVEDQRSPIYVDLTAVPKRQIVAIDDPSVDLCGQVGTMLFDLYHTRFHDGATASAS